MKINELGEEVSEKEIEKGEKVGSKQSKNNLNKPHGKNKTPMRQDEKQPTQSNQEYNNLTKEELINEIRKNKLENGQLQKIITYLENKIKELEEEIADLKVERTKTSEVSEQQEISQEVQRKEFQLQELKAGLKEINISDNATANNNTSNDFPTSLLVVGVVSLVGLCLFILIKKVKKNGLKKK